MKKRLVVLLFGLALGPATGLCGLSFPPPTGYVNDYAHVIPPDQAGQIESVLQELEEKTGAQVAVVALPTLDGADLNDTAVDLFKRWGIGQKKKDNGVLILAAMKERQVRIEVGYGLEPVIPDGEAGSIIRQYIVPSFKQGDYGSGFLVGTVAVAQLIAQDAGVTLSGRSADLPLSPQDSPPENLAFWAFVFVFIILWIALTLNRRHGGFWGGGYWGGGFGGGSWGGGGFGGGGGGFGGFGGGGSGGGGASGGW